MATKLKDLFPNYYANGGLFDYLITAGATYINDPDAFNLQYIGNHSGNKAVSTLLDDIAPNGVFSNEEATLTTLANAAMKLYGSNWSAIYEALILEYSLLDNYDSTETTVDTRSTVVDGSEVNTIDRDNTKNVNLNETHTKATEVETTDTMAYGKIDTNVVDSNEVNTKGTTDTTTYGKVTTTNNDVDALTGVYSFNTPETMTNTDQVKTSNDTVDTLSGTDRIASTGSDSNALDVTNTSSLSGSDVNTVNVANSGADTDLIVHAETGSDTGTESLAIDRTTTEKFNHETRTVGNIGVNTNQDMLNAELKFRTDHVLCEYIFKDLDKLLTSPIYV